MGRIQWGIEFVFLMLFDGIFFFFPEALCITAAGDLRGALRTWARTGYYLRLKAVKLLFSQHLKGKPVTFS